MQSRYPCNAPCDTLHFTSSNFLKNYRPRNLTSPEKSGLNTDTRCAGLTSRIEYLVELVGIEPTTYGLQSRRSPS